MHYRHMTHVYSANVRCRIIMLKIYCFLDLTVLTESITTGVCVREREREAKPISIRQQTHTASTAGYLQTLCPCEHKAIMPKT